MAHFARLDENNIVVEVFVVGNADILDGNGDESEAVGQAFLQNITGSTDVFKQTSYNDNFRHRYAQIGGEYDSTNDVFWPVKPFASWVKNTTTFDWEAPVARPDPQDPDGVMIWDEDNQTWSEQVTV